MSSSSSTTDPNSAASSRKRHSPTSRSKLDSEDAAGSSSSSITSAQCSKQRKIGGPSAEDQEVAEIASRELRDLHDFFPDQAEDGPLTRSKAKHTGSPLPREPLIIPQRRRQMTKPSARGGQLRYEDVPSSSSASSSSNSQQIIQAVPTMDDMLVPPIPIIQHPTLHHTPLLNTSPWTRPMAAMMDEVASSSQQHARDLAAYNLVSAQIGIQSRYISQQAAMLHQIPVIQNTGHPPVGVPLGLSGMLFDPISATNGQPSTATSRALSRSAASQFIHGLVPRMQHLLGGHKPAQQDGRVSGIMEGLRSANEIRQAEAAGELAEWLLMANEDSLPTHLPIREIVQSLIQLLQMEHNFELMLTAARCIRNLLEAIPRAQPIVIEAVPCLLEKLKRIECVDVAEQSLTALEELSKRNSKTILLAGGIAACISHVDFFSIASQRLAFSIAANCATYLGANEFNHVRDSLSDLTERLLIEDKRCLESVCQLFSRLVDNLKNHPDKLREIAGVNCRLLALIQQHLVSQPCQLSSSIFSSIVRTVRTMASRCPDIAAALIRMNYHITLRTLFIGNIEEGEKNQDLVEIIERPPNQLQDMVYLIGEMFPTLPTTGIFEIDQVFLKSNPSDVQWYWQDDDMHWQPFRPQDSKVIEIARESGQSVHDMPIGSHLYRIDLAGCTQRNIQTGKERNIQRRSASVNRAPAKSLEEDSRLTLLQSDPDMVEKVVHTLFPILVAIDGSSSGPALRFECLRVMLRMICPIPSAVLRDVLADLPLSGHIASALASPRTKDICIVVAALQMVHLLLEKMSDIYSPLFRKEGVVHEIQKLAAVSGKIAESKSAPSSTVSSPLQSSESSTRVTRSQRNKSISTAQSTEEAKSRSKRDKPDVPRDNRRKRASPDGSPVSKKEKEPRRKSSGILNALRIPGIGGMGRASTSSASSFAEPATPPPMAGLISSLIVQSGSSPSSRTKSSTDSQMSSSSKDKLRQWIKKEAALLLKTYFSDCGSDGAIIDSLSWISEQLKTVSIDVGTTPLSQLHDILSKDSVSAFEMMYSGVIPALHMYLVNEDLVPMREERLKRFAAIFMHLEENNLRPTGADGCFNSFESLVTKVLASVSQLEQFPVKVNDMGGIVTGTATLRGAQALRFFQNHQIKCYLRRHPNCHDLKDYHRHGGSTIKVDPFTSISAIERYLADKELSRIRGEESSGDDMSDDDSAVVTSPPNGEEKRIEILIGDQALPSQMSVLQALRQYSPFMNSGEEGQTIGSSLWMTTHTLLYRSAAEASKPTASGSISSSGSQPKEKKRKINERLWNEGEVDSNKDSLYQFLQPVLPYPIEDPSVPALLLLRALHGLNRFWYDLFDIETSPPTSFAPILPLGAFNSSKLSAKMHRQLSDFISVATQQLPPWTLDLAKGMPFLFSFSLRRTLLYCTSFGRDRALMHLVHQTEGVHGEGEAGRLTPRIERRKIVVKRDDLLRSADAALSANASSRATLEVSFEGEAGTGFGPTLEFYSTVSREMQNAVHRMWHGPTEKDKSEIDYTVAGHGLYPAPVCQSSRKEGSKIKKFETLGRLMGQALIDSRMLDLPLSPVFLHWISSEPSQIGVPQLEQLDPQLYQSLRSMAMTAEEDFEHMEQYFTLPGNETFDLMKNGRNIQVSKENVAKYIKLVASWRLVEGVWKEMEAVKKGFSQVIDPAYLLLFMPEELDQLFCGCSDGGERIWGEQILAQAIKPDHGYTHDSDQIRWLVKMLANYSSDEQRKFVQFVTGSPRLPVGGFRALTPPLTVVKKTASYGSGDEELPSAMTCYNYLKVPAYSSYKIFKERFQVALQFAQSFHLT